MSIKTSLYENGEWVEHILTYEDEICRHVEEKKRKAKEEEDRQWKRNLMREMYKK